MEILEDATSFVWWKYGKIRQNKAMTNRQFKLTYVSRVKCFKEAFGIL